MPDWYYAKNGKQFGPISPTQLKQMAQSGELVPDDLVFQEGGTQWVSASTVKGLFDRPGAASAPPSRGAVTSGRDRDFDRGPPPDDRDERRDEPPRDDRAPRPSQPPSERGSYFVDLLFFRRLIAPTMIQILFWVGVASSLISGLITMLMGLIALFQQGAVGLVMILVGLLSIPIGILLVRLWCEVMILFFRMNETLMDIKETLERTQKKEKES